MKLLFTLSLAVETGSLILAAQDQALNIKYFNASILGGSDPLCRLCGTNNETVAYIVCGCSTLVGTSYKKHHDAVGRRMHWCLCSQFSFPVVKEWWKHNPRSVEESESVKLLWDFTITTDSTTHVNRPDLILVLKEERRAYLVDFSCSFDNNVTRKEAVGTILRNGTERNDGLNCGTECFLRLKLAAYHCCTSYQWHFQQVIKRTPRKIKRI